MALLAAPIIKNKHIWSLWKNILDQTQMSCNTKLNWDLSEKIKKTVIK